MKKALILLGIFSVLSLCISVYLLFKAPAPTIAKAHIAPDADQQFKEIETYLDSISEPYITDVQKLANEYHWPSWGCGPSSYALAKIINKKFFDDQLTISASYSNNDQVHIVERFGLAKSGERVGDHSWLEIYIQDKFLFIDPTIGQFGKIHTIAHQVFTVGDPTIQNTLKEKYSIEDVRLVLLVKKVVDRVPISQEPYPGMIIDQKSISYFLKVMEYRNDVNDGIEPDEWKAWVASLTKKYQS